MQVLIYLLLMNSRVRKSFGITHSLTPLIQVTTHQIPPVPQIPSRKHSPLYTKNVFINPHALRSRKHRLLEEKNTEIERQNRRLYERLRKIKLKNAYQSETKIDISHQSPEEPFWSNSVSKPLSLPQVTQQNYSLGGTKSQLNTILNDRKTFVNKYFEDLVHLRNKPPKKTQELGNFNCYGWRVKTLLLDDEFIVLRGKKGIKQLTKKYKWERVQGKMTNGLEEWVGSKFEFED